MYICSYVFTVTKFLSRKVKTIYKIRECPFYHTVTNAWQLFKKEKEISTKENESMQFARWENGRRDRIQQLENQN